MTDYHKLVRDKIPEIIRANGEEPVTRILTDDEYLPALIAKLKEETAEFEVDHSVEELADIAEVLQALANAIGQSPNAVEQARKEKATKRGGFEQRIFLERTN